MDFAKSKFNPKLYYKVVEDEPIILYVDDLFLVGNEKQIVESKNVVSYKWICKIKYVADRSKEKLVARGFYKKEGIDSEETLTPGSKVHDEVKTSLP